MSIPLFILVSVIKIALILFVLLTAVAYTVWLERKVVGHMQNRWGPTRVGPFGLLQPAADGVKFLFKEDLTPPHVYKPLYIAAPMIAVVFAVTSIAVIPFGNWLNVGKISTPFQITDVNIGLLIVLGITSMGVYGVALSGWSSNSKYSLLGGLRASAQMVSYENRVGRGLSHRVQRHEICDVFHGRVRQHDHCCVPGVVAVSGRMARTSVWSRLAATAAAAVLVCLAGVRISFCLHLGAWHVATFSI